MLLCYVFLVENLSFAGICPKWSQMAWRAENSLGELKNFRATFLISNPAIVCLTLTWLTGFPLFYYKKFVFTTQTWQTS